jgi:phosphatidylserine/phosphatidylglycerophosphate/cardiolipin synthase-like enzyme
MPFLSRAVELYLGPTAVGAPDDLEAAVVGFVAEARETLAVAVQEIDSREIAAAIIAAKRRGVRVRVILEGDYLVETRRLDDPWLPAGTYEENRAVCSALLRAGVDVVSDLNPQIFHQKFVVRDSGRPTAAVLTGSTNFTLTDTGRAVGGNNLNHVLVLNGKQPASVYQREFDVLRAGTFGALRERVSPRPTEYYGSDIRIKPVFAPDQGPEMEIMKQMLKAERSVDFAIFTFAQSSGIDDTMFRLVPSLERLRGVLDRNQGSQQWAATQPLLAAGVELHHNKTGTGVRTVHHKLMVVDGEVVVAGSFNYTDPANTLNDENIVVLGDLDLRYATDEKAAERRAAQQALAAYVLAEIDRIVTDLSVPVPRTADG